MPAPKREQEGEREERKRKQEARRWPATRPRQAGKRRGARQGRPGGGHTPPASAAAAHYGPPPTRSPSHAAPAAPSPIGPGSGQPPHAAACAPADPAAAPQSPPKARQPLRKARTARQAQTSPHPDPSQNTQPIVPTGLRASVHPQQRRCGGVSGETSRGSTSQARRRRPALGGRMHLGETAGQLANLRGTPRRHRLLVGRRGIEVHGGRSAVPLIRRRLC
jgi:hypothetical protein